LNKVPRHQFFQLDVFTDSAFHGNPLAVFPEGGELTVDQMQKIAREMNLSETVFVVSSMVALRRLRIFTPTRELPLAGHPVVGTWNLLARLGISPKVENGIVAIEHELGVGVLPVEIEFRDGNVVCVTMTQGNFSTKNVRQTDGELNRLADALGLQRKDFCDDKRFPFQISSTGIPALIVPVRNLESLGRCKINSSLLAEIYSQMNAIGCYVFTTETVDGGNSRAHARFFAPDDGIAEDAATGSAAGSLAGYLVSNGAIKPAEKDSQFIVEQGDFMGRPSRIRASVMGSKGKIETVRIGGNSVLVAEGFLTT